MGDAGTYFQHQTFYRTSTANLTVTDEKGKGLFKNELAMNPPRDKVDLNAPVVVVYANDNKAKLSDDDANKLTGKLVLDVLGH